jgi:small subunit ribosomal protein S8
MSIDAIGDFLTVIRNGISVSRRYVFVPHSKIKQRLAEVLKNEGFINDFQVIDEGNNKRVIKIVLKYIGGESAIHAIARVSSPGRKVYQGVDSLQHVIGKLGISIVSTNRGIMTNKEARERSVGGEVLCSVW